MLETIAALSFGKIAIIGFFVFLTAGAIFGTRNKNKYFWLAQAMKNNPNADWATAFRISPSAETLPSAVRVLGYGIVLVSLGIGLVVRHTVVPGAGAWTSLGVVALSVGVGVVIYAIVVAIVQRKKVERETGRDAVTATEG